MVKLKKLASRMKQRKYLDESVKITLQRYRQKKNLEQFFTMEDTLVACKDVDGLFKALNMSHCSDEWRLFIDSSKVSLKLFFCTMGMCYLPFLLHIHLELKKEMIA